MMMIERLSAYPSFFKKILLALALLQTACFVEAAETNHQISVAGNSWLVNPTPGNTDNIPHEGRMKWTNPESLIKTYFKTTKPGELSLAIRARADQGAAKIRFTFKGKTKETVITNTVFEIIPVMVASTTEPGYQYLETQGIEKQGASFPEISDIVVGNKTSGELYYVKEELYWGRRGPSVHLNLIPPKDVGNIVYFYNELTVPEGSDVPGAYYMANGFSGGYFGMQANSPTERRFLFSVWSPYHTDNPKDIPEAFKVKLLKKGADVHGGEFGGEGSGGQSYRRYFWKAGVTYKFLLKGEPSGTNATDFTAWMFAPEVGTWELMASFRQPKSASYLKHPHSFLENFRTDTGYLSRTVFYSNQWVYNTDQQWREITEFQFSFDPTGHKKSRLDYAGGTDGSRFFLKNCGFFDADVKSGTRFTRKPSGQPPVIDFAKLP
jgi:hypothetical protein